MSSTVTSVPRQNADSSSTTHDQHLHHNSSHIPSQLLRVRIINAVLDNLKNSADTYAVVSIGKQSARTKVVKDTNLPVYEENFSIAYELEDDKSEIVVDVFEKGTLHDSRVGEFRLNLGQVDPPKARKARTNEGEKKKTSTQEPQEELPLPTDKMGVAPKKSVRSWSQAQPREAPLMDAKGNRVGTLSLLVRREERLHGNLHLHFSDLDLSKANKKGLPWASSAPKLVVKFGGVRHEAQGSLGDQHLAPFKTDVNFHVDDTNNLHDVFVELWQEGEARAEGRIPLYDARKRGRRGEVTLIGPFGGHDVTDCSKERYEVGVVRFNSDFEAQQLA